MNMQNRVGPKAEEKLRTQNVMYCQMSTDVVCSLWQLGQSIKDLNSVEFERHWECCQYMRPL